MDQTLIQIRMVVFDWAGTTVDHGCFAPVAAFHESLARFGVELTPDQIRVPMGIHKRDHIEALLKTESASEQWLAHNSKPWTQDDVEGIFRDHFMPLQLEAAVRHSLLIEGLLDVVAELRDMGIQIGTSTGYFKSVAEQVFAFGREQGYEPDFNQCADDVPAGRPAPWMIYRCMQEFGVFPPACVLKVGDTLPDIGEGLNAGTWSVAVTHSCSDLGLTLEEFDSLDLLDRDERVDAVTEKFRSAGAHEVIDSVRAVPALIRHINERLSHGERPTYP